MKKVLFVLTTLLLVLPLGMSAKKPSLKLVANVEVLSHHEGEASRITFLVSDMMFNSTYVEGFRVWNGTSSRIYLQWEDARLANSRVCFKGDTPQNYQNPKADESVFGSSLSIGRDLFPSNNIDTYDNTLYPIYNAYELKRKGGSDFIKLKLPIKFADNHVELFEIKITYQYVPEEQ